LAEYHRIKNNVASRNRFLMSPTKWKKLTNIRGIIPSSGKYSIGTYASNDIARKQMILLQKNKSLDNLKKIK